MASLDQLKAKYRAVLDGAAEFNLHFDSINVQGDKLVLKGTVPTEHLKNRVWDEIKKADPAFGDLSADIRVQGGASYTVVAGDSLSKIAKRYYGDPAQYPKIFEANRDQLKDPDKIQVGQKLRIP